MFIPTWIFVWGGALLYTGGVNPFWLCIVFSLLSIPLIRYIFQYETYYVNRIDSSTNIVATMMLLWLVISAPFSELPAVTYHVSLVVSALPLSYLLLRPCLSRQICWKQLESPLRWVGATVAIVMVAEALIKRGRPFGVFEDANVPAALWNALFFPAYLSLISRWVALTKMRRGVSLLFLLLMMTALALSDSMGGQISFIGGLLLSTLLCGWRSALSYKALTVSLLSMILLSHFATSVVSGRPTLERVAQSTEDQSITDRIEMIKGVWQIHLDHPTLGSGVGTFKLLYPAVRSPLDISTSGDLAHNDYLQFLAEGGPPLFFCLIALFAWVLMRAWQLIFNIGELRTNQVERIQTGGYVVALLCLFTHAVVNFIFYVLPLALIAGTYLARVEVSMSRPAPQKSGRSTFNMYWTIGLALQSVVLTTLLMQSLFLAVSTKSCELTVCRELTRQERVISKFANLFISIQPTWLPARDYLIERLRDSALKQTDPAARQMRLKLAAQEVIQSIEVAPAVDYSYAVLADLILQETSIAQIIPAHIPNTAVDLYAAALRRQPQNQLTRLALANQLEEKGRNREAFDLVNVDGMRWWKTSVVTDFERGAMLRFLIPRAIRFGMCADAREMAKSLEILEVDNVKPHETSIMLQKTLDSPGCGDVDPLA